MKIVYGKKLTAEESTVVKDISASCGILQDTARLLFYRNVSSVKKAREFLNPDESGLNDPFALLGMKEAVDRITVAKEQKENVLIFGDYDADGICASSVLYYCLKEFGIDSLVTVPEREDGYGLNVGIIKRIKSERNISLIITVDCGISDCEKIEEIKNLGLDVIVTDHHEPPSLLPDCIKINPKITGQSYPFDGLCGAGVAYKLGYALIGKNANAYLDLVALATVADSMDLIDENRCIVVLGLKLMNGVKKRAVFDYLAGANDKRLTAQSLAFGVAPRVNAGGRMGDAATALRAFISDKPSEIYELCVKLNQYNIARQADCDAIYKEAKEKINGNKLYKNPVITVEGEGWKTGFIGIVAARLVEDYNRPVIAFARNADGFMKGSARSVEGFNVYDAICAAGEYTLGFGGHSQAAGVSLNYESYDGFSKSICDYARKTGTAVREKEIYVDMKAEEPLTVRFAKELDRLEPFGVGNRKPVMSVAVESVKVKALKNGSPHYSFNTDIGEMLDFNGEGDVSDLLLNVKKEIVFEPNYSVFRNKESVKGFVKYVLPDYGDFSAASLKIFNNQLIKLKEKDCGSYKQILSKEVKIESGCGVLYILSNERNLSYYDLSKVNAYLFSKKDKTNANCLIVGAEAIPDGYEKVVYLDKPSYVFPNVDSEACVDLCGYARMKNLSVDRSEFESIFRFLCEKENSVFESPSLFFDSERPDFNAEQFVFVSEVFIELGFFRINGGRLIRDRKIKKALSESLIYGAVCAMRVDYD